jgi:hypothetical protein
VQPTKTQKFTKMTSELRSEIYKAKRDFQAKGIHREDVVTQKSLGAQKVGAPVP